VTLLVLIYQSFVLALNQIAANKLRSILTTLGIVIGVASVTAVIAALSGMRDGVLNQFEKFGTNKVFIFPDRPQRGPQRTMPSNSIRFTAELFDELLTAAPSLKAFTRNVSFNDTVRSDTVTIAGVNINGIDPAWHAIENRAVTLGQTFSLVHAEQGSAVCLINPKTIEKLDLPKDPTNELITIGNRQYRIVGVVEPRIETAAFMPGGQSEVEIFVPFATAWRAATAKSGGNRPFMFVVAAANSANVAADAKAEVLYYLRKARRIELGAPDTFSVGFVDQFVQLVNSASIGITAVATGIVGISLVVGGVGIMNIMLVSVSERTREIGLRKAVGARPSAILLQFLIEAVVLCCIGGGVGLAFGQGVTMLLRNLPGDYLAAAAIPGWAIVMSFGFSAAVGVVFGMFPAIKAARLDPIEALRHE
jgi:putative ABC transport system permease protein